MQDRNLQKESGTYRLENMQEIKQIVCTKADAGISFLNVTPVPFYVIFIIYISYSVSVVHLNMRNYTICYQICCKLLSNDIKGFYFFLYIHKRHLTFLKKNLESIEQNVCVKLTKTYLLRQINDF